MISSVVANLDSQFPIDATIAEIVSCAEMETGELIDDRLLPITIESADNKLMEQKLRWLQQLPGICFVDVVYVNWEIESGDPADS